MKNRFKKIIFVSLGFLFTGIGALGVILPILPTTPFLLLASFFFTKGSDRFNNWFMATKLYKNYLESFLVNRSMELKTKVRLLSLASSVLILSGFMVKIRAFRIFMVCVMIYMYYYFIFRIKTIESKRKGDVCFAERKNI